MISSFRVFFNDRVVEAQPLFTNVARITPEVNKSVRIDLRTKGFKI